MVNASEEMLDRVERTAGRLRKELATANKRIEELEAASIVDFDARDRYLTRIEELEMDRAERLRVAVRNASRSVEGGER